MRKCVLEKVRAFQALNDLALRDEIAVFGSTYMASFPFYELINRCRLENAVYNRSIEGLTAKEGEEILRVAVLDIRPRKVFLCFEGEKAEGLHALVAHIRAALPHARIYLVILPGDQACCEAAEERQDVYTIRLTTADTGMNGYKRAFKQLCCFFREKRLDLVDAFSIAAL